MFSREFKPAPAIRPASCCPVLQGLSGGSRRKGAQRAPGALLTRPHVNSPHRRRGARATTANTCTADLSGVRRRQHQSPNRRIAQRLRPYFGRETPVPLIGSGAAALRTFPRFKYWCSTKPISHAGHGLHHGEKNIIKLLSQHPKITVLRHLLGRHPGFGGTPAAQSARRWCRGRAMRPSDSWSSALIACRRSRSGTCWLDPDSRRSVAPGIDLHAHQARREHHNTTIGRCPRSKRRPFTATKARQRV